MKIITRIQGVLEIDHDRGVIYFHAVSETALKKFGGPTILRICSLPKQIPFECLDITHLYGTNWDKS